MAASHGFRVLDSKRPAVSVSQRASQEMLWMAAEDHDQETGSEDTGKTKPATDSWD